MQGGVKAIPAACPLMHSRLCKQIRRILLGLLMLPGTSCSDTPHREPPSAYAIMTNFGPVLIKSDGFARGLTRSALDELTRTGMTQANRGQVRAVSKDDVMPIDQLLLHVEEGFQPAREQVTLQLLHAGTVIGSTTTNAPGASAFPNAVFIHTVASLAQRLLPAIDSNL